MGNNTYYGGQEPREAMKDLYSPAAQQHQYSGSCINRVLSGRHVLVVGETGSGKTFFVCEVCKLLPSFIFINSQEERDVDKVTQIVLEDENEVIEALEDGYRKIQFIPSEDEDEAMKQVETIRLDLWAIAREMNIKDGEWWINYIIDEAEIYAPLHSRTNLQKLARRGRRYGVKSWFLTQQPQDLAKGIVNNCPRTVIFQLGTFAEPYYTRFHIPIEEEREWLARDHYFVVWDKHNMQRCPAL